MLLFIDTTEFFGDYRLNKPEFELLKRFLAVSHTTLHIPAIVLQELVNHYRETVARMARDVESNNRSLKALVPEVAEVKLGVDSAAEAVKYEQDLREMFHKMGAKIIPYDAIKMELIVGRALARRKPFDAKGHKGFRDALIWQTLLGVLLVAREPAILITDNSKDFGEPGKLPADLQRDIDAFEDESLTVTVCSHLSEFVTEYIKPTFAKLQQIQDQLNEETYDPFRVSDFLATDQDGLFDAIKSHLQCVDIDRVTRGTKGEYLGPLSLSSIEDVEEWEVIDAWEVEKGRIAFGLNVTMLSLVECSVRVYEDCGPDYGYDMYNGEHNGYLHCKLCLLVMVSPDEPEDFTWELTDMDVEQGRGWE